MPTAKPDPKKAEAWKDIAINPATDPQDFMKEDASDVAAITEGTENDRTRQSTEIPEREE
ncbi:MAG: hypothetical protein ACOC0N_04015 [Chroococcales cyanobacterium]